LEKEADGPGQFAGYGKRRKRKAGRGGVGRKGGKGKGGEVWVFLFKFFSKSFFKLSNFTQTRNHALES
jgi:hypothetical protein